jgi:hypothetical protein
MAQIPGVPVTGTIVPTDSTDTYPVTDGTYGLGGYREVADLPARDAIPAQRRRAGMVVYVQAAGLAYRLVGGTANANWVPDASGGDLSYTHNQLVPAATWTINHNLGKKPAVSVTDSAGSEVVGDVTYLDLNTVVVSFAAAFAGTSFLN